jgi:hypothetical protein
MADDMDTMFVANGRTVYTGTWTGPNAAPVQNGPGVALTMERSEIERLAKLGFLQREPPTIAQRATTSNPGRVGPAGPAQGPSYQR